MWEPKKFAIVVVMVGFLALLGARGAIAGGLELREQGAAAIGMSDAVTSKLDHPSTVYFNPAGMAFLEGLQVSAGATFVMPQFGYRDPEGNHPSASNTNKVLTPPHFYASWRISEQFATGLSFNVPFGLGLQWPSDFGGRHMTVGSEMQIFLINPNFAYRPFESLSIAVGLQLMPGTVEIERRFGFVTDEGRISEGGVELGGLGFGIGANFGVMYRPLDWLNLGFFYRSRVAMTFYGDAHFDVPAGVGDRSVFHDQSVEASVVLPDYMVIGIGFQVLPELYLAFDLDIVLWSSVDNIGIRFPNDQSGQLTEDVRQDWRDTVTPRLGIEWRALDLPLHRLIVRFGGGYDMPPTPDHTLSPMLPDSHRIFTSTGLGYTYKPFGLTFDVGYMMTNFLPRTVGRDDCRDDYCNPFPAEYKTRVHLLAVDLSWQIF